MDRTRRSETIRYIDEFLRDAPEVFDQVPFFQEKMAEYEKRAEQQGEQQARQRVLLMWLRQKFAFVPEYVVREVESTTDQEQFTSWLKQILSANTLQEMGFGPIPVNQSGK